MKYSLRKGLHTSEKFKEEKHFLTWGVDGLSLKTTTPPKKPQYVSSTQITNWNFSIPNSSSENMSSQ